MAFYSVKTIPAKERDEEVKRLRRSGPGLVSVEATTPLPNGFLAMSLVHTNSRGHKVGYTTVVTYPETEAITVR